MRTLTTLLVVCSGAIAVGCLDPQGSEDIGFSSHVQAQGTRVPSIESEEPLKLKIDTNDGIDGASVPLRTGFADGKPARYWDFGTTAGSAEPLWRFRKQDDAGDLSVGHPDLIDSIPGDTSYSPLRAIYVVYVTKAYHGERITSLRALDDAIELGLVREPKALGAFTNCPVALADTRLELGGSQEPKKPTRVYYRGRAATHFCLEDFAAHGRFMLPQKGPIPTPNAYSLRRQNDSVALDEAELQADQNADGDLLDSNVVFSIGVQDMRYSSLWREVAVTVATDHAWDQSRAESDLFAKQPWGAQAIDGVVLESGATETLWNRPLQGGAP